MSLPRYARYAKSGIDWVGEIPAHWNVKRLKFMATVQTGIAKGKDIAGRKTITVPYLRVANVQDGFLALDEVTTIDIEPEQLSRYRLQFGDVLMNEGGDFDKLGRGAIWHGEIEDCIHQNHVFAVRPHKVNSDWLNQVTSSRYAQFYFMGRSKQSTNLASISSSNIMELPVLLPPEEEQKAILAFLNRETAKIDALIAEQEKLIVLLTEKRQATISHAVTKGLNPNAPMKDSGVAWLGPVPAHWGISALSYLGSIETGSTPDRGEPSYWNGSIPWLKTGEINWAPIREAEEFITEAGLENSAAKIAKPGTLLMAMYGQGITRGRVALLEIEATYNQACAAIQFGHRITPQFGRYFFMAAYHHVRDAGNETSQMNLSAGLIAKIRLPVPPADEQKAVVRFLDSETTKLDLLVAESERAIALLKERRSTLITAAVTGEIDVRDAIRQAATECLEAIAA